MSKHIVLAAGGTGGHMFPAQSVAEELLARGFEVSLTTDFRGLRYTHNFPKEVEILELQTASPSQGSIIKRLMSPIAMFKGVLTAKSHLKRNHASAVIGFGGYPALPALMAARLTKTMYFIHEQNAILGRVNKLLQSHAQFVACGLWPTKNVKAKAVYVGNPVRANVKKHIAEPLPNKDNFQILVFGGSQGASIFSEIMPEILAKIPLEKRKKIRIIQQARENELSLLKESFQKLSIDYQLAPFFDDLPKLMADSHLVIARAGASTIAELQVIGRGAILVPLPTAMNDHQNENARALVEAKAALKFDQNHDSIDKIVDFLTNVIDEPSQVEFMADQVHNLARVHAESDLIDKVLKEIR